MDGLLDEMVVLGTGVSLRTSLATGDGGADKSLDVFTGVSTATRVLVLSFGAESFSPQAIIIVTDRATTINHNLGCEKHNRFISLHTLYI